MQQEELTALGANSSLIHVDWMIGSGAMDVDGGRCRWDGGAADAQRGMGVGEDDPKPAISLGLSSS